MSSTVASINNEYLELHKEFENHFWTVKMNNEGTDRAALAESKRALDKYLADPANLERVQAAIDKLNGQLKRDR